jgi:recombination protein RecT
MAAQTTDETRNALARQAERNRAERPKRTIADLIERQKAQIARALPKHMDADRLARIALTEIRRNPKLMECSPESLLGAVMLSAQLGLEPGPLGHCYLVPYRNTKLGTTEVQFIPGYKGLIDLAYRSGRLDSIEAREVCERDEFEFEYGLTPKLYHKPCMDGDRGKPIAFYGVAHLKGGGYYFLVISLSDIDDHRRRSKSPDNGPWKTDYMAMARKTVIRAMAPYLPLSVEFAQAVTQDGVVHREIGADMVDAAVDYDTGEIIDGTAAEVPPAEEIPPAAPGALV